MKQVKYDKKPKLKRVNKNKMKLAKPKKLKL